MIVIYMLSDKIPPIPQNAGRKLEVEINTKHFARVVSVHVWRKVAAEKKALQFRVRRVLLPRPEYHSNVFVVLLRPSGILIYII